jgi:hypothetical protein
MDESDLQRHQPLFTKATRELMGHMAQAGITKWVALSIVPHPLKVGTDGKLKSKRPPEAKAELMEGLDDAGFITVVGALDFCACEDHRDESETKEGKFRTHWSTHLFCFVPACEFTEKKLRALRKLFPKSDIVPRPVRAKVFDGDIQGIRYAFKPNFHRRVTYIGEGKTRSGEIRKCRRSRSRPLRPAQRATLSRVLARMKPRERLVLIGVRVQVNLVGLTFVPIRRAE